MPVPTRPATCARSPTQLRIRDTGIRIADQADISRDTAAIYRPPKSKKRQNPPVLAAC